MIIPDRTNRGLTIYQFVQAISDQIIGRGGYQKYKRPFFCVLGHVVATDDQLKDSKMVMRKLHEWANLDNGEEKHPLKPGDGNVGKPDAQKKPIVKREPVTEMQSDTWRRPDTQKQLNAKDQGGFKEKGTSKRRAAPKRNSGVTKTKVDLQNVNPTWSPREQPCSLYLPL